MHNNDNAPVIVGAGQLSWRETDVFRTPTDAVHLAAKAACADTGCRALTRSIDALGMIRFIADANPATSALFPRNPGADVAQRLGLDNPAVMQATIGGNTPQSMVNHFADKLARGEHRAVLIAGAETLATMFHAFGSGEDLAPWSGQETEEPATIGTERSGLNTTEQTHGLFEPINTYPLFENSLAHHRGLTPQQHMEQISELCARMSAVASDNPLAWRSESMSAEQIGKVEQRNRYVGYPYTRAMNALLAVDMAAAVVMTTAGHARELGIDPARCIYLCGGADVNEVWHVSARPELHRSPAIGMAWRAIADQCGIGIDDIGHFDIYSCFPSAVQIACREIGMSSLDKRGVTVTGGLPFFGGPGNNYSLHAIAEMVNTLRDSSSSHGLVTANGLYLTKHSLGLYSSEPPQKPWQPTNTVALQDAVNASEQVPLASTVTGDATVETYTVAFGREGPKQGIIIARNAAGERIVANTDSDETVLQQLLVENPIGKQGCVEEVDGINLFQL